MESENNEWKEKLHLNSNQLVILIYRDAVVFFDNFVFACVIGAATVLIGSGLGALHCAVAST